MLLFLLIDFFVTTIYFVLADILFFVTTKIFYKPGGIYVEIQSRATVQCPRYRAALQLPGETGFFGQYGDADREFQSQAAQSQEYRALVLPAELYTQRPAGVGPRECRGSQAVACALQPVASGRECAHHYAAAVAAAGGDQSG